MDLFIRKSLVMRRKGCLSVCVSRNALEDRSIVEVYLRVATGVTYWSAPFAGVVPGDDTLTYAAYLNGVWSARPFHLSRASDASGFYCTVACFVSCCRAWNLNPLTLMRTVDPDLRLTPSDLLGVKAQARWERAVIPGTWDTPAVRALISALTDHECAALAEVVSEQTLKRRGY